MKKLTEMVPKDLKNRMDAMISETTKTTWMMKAFGLTKVPLLFMANPRVIKINDQEIHVLIPFRKIVKNHINSMYFGALAIGADTAVGMLAMNKIYKSGKKATIVFKDFQMDFLKRAEGDTIFICEEGNKIQKAVDEAFETGERVNTPIPGKAMVKGEDVATFTLTLSIKAKTH